MGCYRNFQGVPCIGVACMHAWVACDCRYRYKPWPKAALTGELTKTQVCTVKHSWDVRRQSLIAHIVSACSMLWTSVLISLSWQWVSPSSLCSLRGVHSFPAWWCVNISILLKEKCTLKKRHYRFAICYSCMVQ